MTIRPELLDSIFGRPAWRERIAVASKTRHAPVWRWFRDEAGWPIVSTWIDEAGEGETDCLAELGTRCVRECLTCTGLIVYVREGETLRGALSEMGVAVAADRKVALVDPDGVNMRSHIGVMARHPNVQRFEGVVAARAWIKRRWR